MILLRLLGVLALIAGAVNLILYIWTRDPRYWSWLRRIAQVTIIIAIAVLVMFVVERLVMVV